ncbi:hypothetical protein WH7805_10229 [Synechococcus sp. WH 7805]|nr:hypothetical protein WH7805_10229 [Synechococcus sp. WH 7805]
MISPQIAVLVSRSMASMQVQLQLFFVVTGSLLGFQQFAPLSKGSFR